MKKKQLKGITVDLDIFRDHINIIYGDMELADRFTQIDHVTNLQDRRTEVDEVDAYFSPKTNTVYVPNLNNIPVLVHELLHATFYITDKYAISFSDKGDEEEIVAYILEHLVRGALNKKGYRTYDEKANKFV